MRTYIVKREEDLTPILEVLLIAHCKCDYFHFPIKLAFAYLVGSPLSICGVVLLCHSEIVYTTNVDGRLCRKP